MAGGVSNGALTYLPRQPPPLAVAQHVARLHLSDLLVHAASLVAWRLHNAALWPHLQHLDVRGCVLLTESMAAAGSSDASPLPSAPHLQSFTWRAERTPSPDEMRALTPLLVNVRRLDVHGGELYGSASATLVADVPVARMPLLASVRLGARALAGRALPALLEHPTVRHVELPVTLSELRGLRVERPCGWRTLTLTRGACVEALGLPALAGLERLTVHGALSIEGGGDDDGDGGGGGNAEAQAGVALLQRLHARGALALLPGALRRHLESKWQLRPDDGVFELPAGGGALPALLELVVAAGRGVDAILLTERRRLPHLHEEAPPPPLSAAQTPTRGPPQVLGLALPADVERCAGVLCALPACIARVTVGGIRAGDGDGLRALVRGGVAALRRPVQLTLVLAYDTGRKARRALREVVEQALGGRDAPAQQPTQQQQPKQRLLTVVWATASTW